MNEQAVETLDLRSPALWDGCSSERMWALYRAHLDRALDAALPKGRLNAVARVVACNDPAPSIP